MTVSREMVFTRLTKWKDSSTKVRVSLRGPSLGKDKSPFVRLQLDGLIKLADGITVVISSADNSSLVEMQLVDECVFNSVTFGGPDPADCTDLDFVLQIDFPTGDSCVLFFMRPLN